QLSPPLAPVVSAASGYHGVRPAAAGRVLCRRAENSPSIARGLSQAPQAEANLQTVIRGMGTPGDPAYESLKTVVMRVNDLVHYESYGYATFLLIRWKLDLPIPWCRTEVITVASGWTGPGLRLPRFGGESILRVSTCSHHFPY